MRAHSISAYTHTVKPYNEDVFGLSEHACWVLDGASALNKGQLTGHDNDVYWVVNWWNAYLKREIDDLGRGIKEILEQGVDELNSDFARFTDPQALSKLDRVSSAIAVARVNRDRLECFVMGDTEVNIRMKDRSCLNLTCTEINSLDRQVMDLMAADRNREERIVFKGFTQRELDLLRVNRNKMNTPEGYWILEHDREAIRHGLYREISQEDAEALLLMSDGYAQLYQTYDLAEIFRLSLEEGIEKTVADLRVREARDAEKKDYQRLKTHDDVTAVSVVL